MNTNKPQMPATAKAKKIQREAYDDTKVTVRIAERPMASELSRRIVDVWTEDGRYLGALEATAGQSSTRLYGNAANYGQVFAAWRTVDGWQDHRSMAAAIRDLLR